MNDTLRKEVKLLKALQSITYTEIAEYMEIKQNSFYNWLNGQFELSQRNLERLQDIINTLRED